MITLLTRPPGSYEQYSMLPADKVGALVAGQQYFVQAMSVSFQSRTLP